MIFPRKYLTKAQSTRKTRREDEVWLCALYDLRASVKEYSNRLLAIVFFCLGLTLYAQAPVIRCAVMPENPRPGEFVTIGVNDGCGAITAALLSGGIRLAKAVFFPVPAGGENRAFMAAVLAVPSTAKPGGVVIVIEGAPGKITEMPLTISAREFHSEVIDLNAALSGLRTDPDPQKTAESEQLWEILNSTGKETHHFGSFIPPVDSIRRTSQFGVRRIYRYANGKSDVSIHAGVDYGVPTGTPVSACAPGRVVLARRRIVTGNSVIIEHLPGVYSLYYHLNTIEAAEGSLVAAGNLLGYSGATGLATGPHLHWEIRVSGENADPDAFIGRPIIDKNAILSKIQ